jgi:K+-sensing histidine kinase KdpD
MESRLGGSGFVVLLVCVILATGCAGILAGLTATALSAVSLDYLVLEPRFGLELTHAGHVVRLVAVVAVSAVVGDVYAA